MRALMLMTASLFVLSGCATVDIRPEPTHVPPSPTPDWEEPAPDDLPTTDWVGTFSDGQLVALVNEALAANTNIRAAEAQYRAALAAIEIAGADKLPNISGSTRVNRSEPFSSGSSSVFIPGIDPGLLPDLGGGGGNTNISLTINATWEADLWGRIRDQIGASELEAAATSADFAGARLSIVGQVAQTWFDLIEAQLLVELSARDVETQERSLRLTERRFEGGVTGSSDVRLARSQLANSQALQASRRQSVSALARRLEILLRRYPAEEIQAAADLPVLPRLTGAAGPAYVLRKRPDLLAAERRMQAAGLQVDIARKNLLPRLSFDGNLNTNGSSFSDVFDIDSLVANIAGGLTQPIFQGGRLKAAVEQRDALLRAQLESYAGTALNAYLEVENALDAEERLFEREQALRIAVVEAQEAENRLETRYVEGLATILQLLDAQSRRISAEGQLITARAERLANRVRLHVALGGGFETNETDAFLVAEN